MKNLNAISPVLAITFAVVALALVCAQQQKKLSILEEKQQKLSILEEKHVSDMNMIMDELKSSRYLADEQQESSPSSAPTPSSPFTCSGDWCTSDAKYFIFPKGVIIGKRNTACNYGVGVLSVDNYNNEEVSGGNCAAGNGSITSGAANSAIGTGSVVAGGSFNGANGDLSVITGGTSNRAEAQYTVISGGQENTAKGYTSSILGGYLNMASNQHATVAGGQRNKASGEFSLAAGGSRNHAKGRSSSVTGGLANIASGPQSSVAGGKQNNANGDTSFVAGGSKNIARMVWSSITGGYNNRILRVNLDENSASISGGRENTAKSAFASISGGRKNTAGSGMKGYRGRYSSILGGTGVVLTKDLATSPS